VVVRPVGPTAKLSKTTLDAAYGRDMNIKFSGNSSGGHSCSQHVNCTLPQLETSVALSCDNCTVEWPFIVPQHKLHLCQLIDMPHLSGGWIILAKAKCSLIGM
jgi:hypothetical protein